MSRNHRALDARRWAHVRRLVFDRDGYRCRACGRAGRLECDHRTPLEQGGAEWDMGNLQSLCRTCHIRKTTGERIEKLPADVRAWRRLIEERMWT